MEISRVAQGGAITSQTDLGMPIPSGPRVEVEQPKPDLDANKPQQELPILTKKEARAAVDGLNNLLAGSNAHLKFEYHEKLHEYYVTIVDEETKEVVREIPPKKLLDMVAAMWQQIGLIVDKKI